MSADALIGGSIVAIGIVYLVLAVLIHQERPR
jgi:hypothetical protein